MSVLRLRRVRNPNCPTSVRYNTPAVALRMATETATSQEMKPGPHGYSQDVSQSDRAEKWSALLVGHVRQQSGSDREAFVSLQQELHRIARSKMRRERPDHTLQPTALINEAFLKIFKTALPEGFWTEPALALKLIAHAMEQILNDHADAHHAQKRGGPDRKRVAIDDQQAREFVDSKSFAKLDSELLIRPEQSETILGVREALKILRRTSPRQDNIIRLQYYGGLTQEEISASLGISLETVKLDTRKAKAFLKVHLEGK